MTTGVLDPRTVPRTNGSASTRVVASASHVLVATTKAIADRAHYVELAVGA